MNLEAHLDSLLTILLAYYSKNKTQEDVCFSVSPASKKQLIQVIDLTLLDEEAPAARLAQQYQAAKRNAVAAFCIHSIHLKQVYEPNGVSLATVVNFPSGTHPLATVLTQITQAQQLNAKEIDYVFPYQDYLNGNKQEALTHCKKVAQLCMDNELVLKVILETGAFQEMENIYQLSRELIDLGCTFLKTSTGKISKGASFSAVLAMLSAIKDSNSHCGIKISGGVKTPEQAYHYACLAQLITGKTIDKTWFRIGASSLLDSLTSGEPTRTH